MDYSEQFCTAVDTIVAERLNALQFDKTILCKVVEVIDKNTGEYIVKDDLSNFTAYSSGASYKKNDQVYVTIPKGDYSQQKLIVGKYSKNKQESWQSDMQKFIPVTGNLFTDNDVELSLVANGDIENSVAYIYEAEAFSSLIPSNLTHLAVSAEFFADLKTALDGEYGLRIFLKTDKKGYVIDLSNEMMFGNPYNSFSFLTQERVFDLKSVDGDIVILLLKIIRVIRVRLNKLKLKIFLLKQDIIRKILILIQLYYILQMIPIIIQMKINSLIEKKLN